MTTPTSLRRHLDWMTQGHRYFLARLGQTSDDQLLEPTALPGWTGRHLLSHVGHNAQALARLAHWASSGEPTPMYGNASARTDEIELGAGWAVPRLREFVVHQQDQLVAALDKIADSNWCTEVVTAQGRTVPASDIPWLRCRELWIHASDLRSGEGFEDFPAQFVDELLLDVLTRRRLNSGLAESVRATDRSEPVDPADEGASRIEARAAELTRWLTGRGGAEALRTSAGAPLPELSAWL
jgi:maleylpyruvate isomerase